MRKSGEPMLRWSLFWILLSLLSTSYQPAYYQSHFWLSVNSKLDFLRPASCYNYWSRVGLALRTHMFSLSIFLSTLFCHSFSSKPLVSVIEFCEGLRTTEYQHFFFSRSKHLCEKKKIVRAPTRKKLELLAAYLVIYYTCRAEPAATLWCCLPCQ